MSATVKHIRRVRSLMNGCLTQNQLPPVPLACSRGRPPQGPEGPGSEPGATSQSRPTQRASAAQLELMLEME